MTASLNRVQLIGTITAHPKSSINKEGQFFISATLATRESFQQDKEWKTKIDYHHLILFGKLIKIATYLKEGSQIYLEGKLRSNLWIDHEENSRSSSIILVNHIRLLDQLKTTDESTEKLLGTIEQNTL
jgi:single-strand DNA-binding protein